MLIDQYLAIVENVQNKTLQIGRGVDEVKVVAVTKFQPIDSLQQLYRSGCRNFGESRVQEGVPKVMQFGGSPLWHFIGTLQSNKVSKVVEHFDLIHSVDSFELAKKISEVSRKQGKATAILLQVNISLESSKHGLRIEEWKQKLVEVNKLEGIQVQGLMTMAPLTMNEKIIRNCFNRLYKLKDEWRGLMRDPGVFHHLSMGMSNDYLLAIEEGATLLRIGSAIFG